HRVACVGGCLGSGELCICQTCEACHKKYSFGAFCGANRDRWQKAGDTFIGESSICNACVVAWRKQQRRKNKPAAAATRKRAGSI
ncbi:hypothetical protein NL533_33490, partial [Klebsiella pneumoniae]|nr:hypothetical protein [Klebsiella pneumoniae]